MDGQAFANVEEFKKILLKDDCQLARNFLQRLTVYATGGEVGFCDRPAIERLLDKCAQVNDGERVAYGAYRVGSLIEELVASELFLSK